MIQYPQTIELRLYGAILRRRILARIYEDITKTIGNTPLVKLNHVTQRLGATVVVKLESLNVVMLPDTGERYLTIELWRKPDSQKIV